MGFESWRRSNDKFSLLLLSVFFKIINILAWLKAKTNKRKLDSEWTSLAHCQGLLRKSSQTIYSKALRLEKIPLMNQLLDINLRCFSFARISRWSNSELIFFQLKHSGQMLPQQWQEEAKKLNSLMDEKTYEHWIEVTRDAQIKKHSYYNILNLLNAENFYFHPEDKVLCHHFLLPIEWVVEKEICYAKATMRKWNKRCFQDYFRSQKKTIFSHHRLSWKL